MALLDDYRKAVNLKTPLRSFLNYGKVRLSYKMKTDRAWGYPSKILIEPTNLCNLACPLCPNGLDTLNRPKGTMPFENFKILIDEIRRYTTYLEVGGFGEPFINKDISRMLRYAVEAGLYVHMHSNTMLINTPEKVKGLVSSGLHRLTASIDGATQEVYEIYRVKGKLSEAVDAMRNIVAEKKRQGSSRPEIEWQVVVTKQNEHEVDDIWKLAAEIGVDRFHAKTANISLIRPAGTADIPKNLLDRFYPKTKIFRRYLDNDDNGYQNRCAWLYKGAFVFWNGDLTTCCLDSSGLNKMGNIFEAGSLMALWNGTLYQTLRRKVNTDISQATPLCSVCPDRVIVELESFG